MHLPDFVSRAEHHPDSRPKLAGEKPEDDGADVLSVPLRFDIDSNIFGWMEKYSSNPFTSIY